LKILNCFCTDLPNSGNPAGVIFNFPGDKTEKQKLVQQWQMTVASVGSPKLFVPLRSVEALATLHPNFDLIKQWSLDNGINGLYVYALESTDPLLLQARAFNPKTGQNEDAATGVAAAALALVFKENLIIKQGYFIGKPSQLMITYHHPEEIYVGGKIMEQLELI
jgi:PhzF family phenazine biosynthesis protein